MSRSGVWLVAAASAAFLASVGVVLGLRLAGTQASPSPAGLQPAAQVERLRQESQQLRRLVAAYRQREALYRQRLQEANSALQRLAGRDSQAPRGTDRWGRGRQEREEHSGPSRARIGSPEHEGPERWEGDGDD